MRATLTRGMTFTIFRDYDDGMHNGGHDDALHDGADHGFTNHGFADGVDDDLLGGM